MLCTCATIVSYNNVGSHVSCLCENIKILIKSRDKRHCWCSFQLFNEPILLTILDSATDGLFNFNVVVDRRDPGNQTQTDEVQNDDFVKTVH